MKLPSILKIILILTFYTQCSDANEEKKLPTPKIVNEVVQFCRENPSISNNEVLKDQGNEKFNKLIIPKIQNGILNDYVFELNGVKEYKPGKFAAHFDMSFLGDNYYMNKDSAYIHGDVIGYVDSLIVTKLKEKEKYILKGTYLKQLSLQELKTYTIYPIWSPAISIEKDYTPDVSLGIMLMDIKEIQPAKQ